MAMEGYVEYAKPDAEKYTTMGWWPGITLGQMLDRAAERFPHKEGLVDERQRLTYAQLRENVDRLAIGLMEAGIRRGEVTLLQLPNWAEWVYSYFALQKIGAVVVVLIAGYGIREINHFAQTSGAKSWIVPRRYRKTDYLPIIQEVREQNPMRVILARADGYEGFESVEGLMRKAELNEANLLNLAARSPEPIDVAHILPSGGTTGMPKLAPRTHNDYLCGVKYKAQACDRNSDEVCLTCTPVGHNLALQITICCTVYTGATMVLLDSTRPEDLCHTLAKERVTFVALVPVLLRRLSNFERLKDYDLSSLRKIHVGAQHSPPDLIRNTLEKMPGIRVISAFGMIEGPNCNTRLGDEKEIVCTTVGRPCCPHDVYKVIDQDQRDLPSNEEGELVAKGPSVFTGYLKTDNTGVFTRDGFVKTGDLAVIDKVGNVRITGRIKDIIIRGGENITAAEVEEAIRRHPDVEDTAVVGMPDEELGEKVCAFVQPYPGKYPTLDDIVSFLKRSGVSKMMFPERMELIQTMPLTQAGKSDKKALRESIRSILAKERR